MRSRFLAALPTVDQVHIFDLSARTAQALHRWAARFPLIRRVRVWPLALSVAAAAPYSSVDALIATARLSLWVFTLDDLFDEERVPIGDLQRRADRYRAIASDQSVTAARDSMAAALREVREDLARYPLFPALAATWSTALCKTIDDMLQEHAWRLQYRRDGADALPSYDAYVETGLYSIGGPPHVWAALITSDDPSTPDHLEHLHRMERAASRCIRLANDLQSSTKEIAEGKINALVLLGAAFRRDGLTDAAAYQQAESCVRLAITQGLDEIAALQRDARTQTQHPERAIADIARFVCEFYTTYDYHTFSSGHPLQEGSISL